MFRRYIISIEVAETAAVELHGITREFGCSISEPSNWTAYGATKDRGLTFLDKEGKELASSVFVHQPVFNGARAGADHELDEIKAFLYQLLLEHYPVTPTDVRIKVREYNRL